jgi:uncharacterized protein YdeI (YjbR/CyaY-like superfamily)
MTSALKAFTSVGEFREALCFGWIDGVRRAVDEETFSTRFTPRRPKSYWSAVNIRRATELKRQGRMHPAGRAAFEARATQKPDRYSLENKPKRPETRARVIIFPT